MSQAPKPQAFPEVGQPWPDVAGTYAGVLTNKSGALYALVLLDARLSTDLNWADAKEWADKAGGGLPNRLEAALLFANVPNALKKSWHWLSEEYSASYAWLCGFDDGGQDDSHKSYEWSAVAVRRFVLESFNPSIPTQSNEGAAA